MGARQSMAARYRAEIEEMCVPTVATVLANETCDAVVVRQAHMCKAPAEAVARAHAIARGGAASACAHEVAMVGAGARRRAAA